MRTHTISIFFLVACFSGGCAPTSGGGGRDAVTCDDACDSDSVRCQGQTVEVCSVGGSGCLEWTVQLDCGAQGAYCDDTGASPVCLPIESCTDGVANQDETDVDCGGVCDPCSTGAQCDVDDDCESEFCDGLVCALCTPDAYSCLGNTVRQCAADGWSWITGLDCGLTEICDATAGVCGPIPVVGNSPGPGDENVTGSYFKYAHFTQADGLNDYCYVSDVDSYEDLIYVHAVAAPCPASYGGVQGHIDVYRVTLLDSDGDGELEPNQHPDNPDNPGPVEERVLTQVDTLYAPIGAVHHSEIFATADKLFFPGMDEMFVEYDLASGQTLDIVDGSILSPSEGRGISFSGYDALNDLWYFATERPRRVYSYDPQISAWSPEFDYPDMSGDHMDGMEFVRDPNSGIGYLYVTDMTSDYIGQYSQDATGNWQQVNLFHYADPDVEAVEGMGFGALNHFWVGGWAAGALYELGGGDLGDYITVD